MTLFTASKLFHSNTCHPVRGSCHRSASSGVDEDVELEHGVGVVEADGLPQHVPSRHPEPPRAADHRQLPHRRTDVVPADDGDGAAGVGSRGEHHVHGHQQLGVPRRRPDVVPLRAPHRRRRPRRALRQHVVDHDGVAEVAPGTVQHLHRRRRRARQHVVHVEVEVRRRRRDGPRRRAGGEDDDEQGDGVELARSHGEEGVCPCVRACFSV
uniref:Uncharacterized protein n=1 Tax=Setaria viridis TaxID=4556 RepID=A0A4U6TM02_SETVI|nr:hypothetical protein SEVIR_8G226400v2 [Setaria viridis]